MKNTNNQVFDGYVKRGRIRNVWKKIVFSMACVVVFCTTYALILPAITVEQDFLCGMEAHTHDESCYTQKSKTVFKVLIMLIF